MATLWLTTYIICIGLVCSFILFEVLDVDGSDFPVPASSVAAPIKLAEPAHEVKRAWLTGPTHLAMLVPIALLLTLVAALQHPYATARPGPQSHPRGRRGLRPLLPRASLDDTAPSS